MNKFIIENNITIEDGKINYINLKTRESICKDFIVNLKDIRKQLKSISYEKEYVRTKKIRDPIIENYKMPQFSFVYYYFLAENLRIPTPRELIDNYFNLFCIKLNDGKYTFKEEFLYMDNIIFDKNSLEARIFRAYNSYNREVEFLLNILDKFKEAKIKYDLIDDLLNGIDLSIYYNDKMYGIATYVGTRLAINYKNKKNRNRHDYSNINMIDVIAIMFGEDKNVIRIGDTYIYKNEVIYNVINKIKNN